MKMSNAEIGKNFEKYFDRCASRNGFSVIRIPDGCRQISQFKTIRVKAPFDFICASANGLVFTDAKTVIGETFSYSKINQDQVNNLLRLSQHGHQAGFTVHFRQINYFGFISARALSEIVPGGSIRARMTTDIGKDINLNLLFSV